MHYLATTQIHSSLLSISVGVLLLPAAYHFVLDDTVGQSSYAEQKRSILKMSHGVSIIWNDGMLDLTTSRYR